MRNRDPHSPWNPAVPVDVSPTEYEQQVVAWLRQAKGTLHDFPVQHQARVTGSSGEYTFDALAEFEILDGARLVILVECKRHGSPVKRDAVLTLEAKLRDVGAHKAMLFSTAGFQRGALDFATERGIATITFIDGKLTYETKSHDPPSTPPGRIQIARFAAWFISTEGQGIQRSLLAAGRAEALEVWLGS